MNNECILTVSVAAYNVENYIKTALNSFSDVCFNDAVEVLIITDGATDNTDTIAQDYVSKYPHIFKLIKKQNGGWGSTLNVGIKNAKGKYFKQLDGDDYFKKENLLDFISFLRANDQDLILSPFSTFDDESGEIIDTQDFNDALANCEFPAKLEDSICYYTRMFMHASCIKTEILQNNNISIEEKCFYTDVEFIVKACAYSRTVNIFNKTIYMYRLGRNGQSMSIAGLEKHYKEHQRIALKLAGFCSDYHGPSKISDAITSRTVGMIVGQYDIYLLISRTDKHKNDLKEFDLQLRKNYPNFYQKTNIGKKIVFLRKTNFALYDLFRIIKKSIS